LNIHRYKDDIKGYHVNLTPILEYWCEPRGRIFFISGRKFFIKWNSLGKP